MPISIKNGSGKNSRVNHRHSVHSPTLESALREVLHTLGNIDFQHAAEMERLEASQADRRAKKHVRQVLLARHRERREPYVELIAGFRQQRHRQALAA